MSFDLLGCLSFKDLGEVSKQVLHGPQAVHERVILPFAVHRRRAINECIADIVRKVDQLPQQVEIKDLVFIP